MGEGEHNKLISKNHSGPRVFIDKSLTGSLCRHVVPLKVVHRDTMLTTTIDVSSRLLGMFTIATSQWPLQPQFVSYSELSQSSCGQVAITIAIVTSLAKLISLELKATLNVQGGKCSNCLGKETSFSCFVGMPSSSKSTCISVVLCHTKHDTHMRCNKYTITVIMGQQSRSQSHPGAWLR